MNNYTFYNLNPYRNTIYKEFYDHLFHELGTHYTMLGFPDNCGTNTNSTFL